MSEFKISGMENTSNGSPSFSQGLNIAGADITASHLISEYYTGELKPTSPKNGAFWWDGTNLHQYINGEFRIFSVTAPPAVGDRAVATGGNAGSYDMQYVSITTPGNTTDFGDLTVARGKGGSASNGSRGIYAGGEINGSPYFQNVIDYFTIATPGNTTDFGDLTVATSDVAGCSNPTYGIFAGGSSSGVAGSNVINYITIATTGNAVDFGDLTVARRLGDCGASNQTYGLFAGGRNASYADVNTIDRITIATAGNATDFGDLLGSSLSVSGTSNLTRAVFTDVGNASDTISYVAPATPGNAADFGNLSVGRSFSACTTDLTYAIFMGGSGTAEVAETIDRVAIDTLGNATDFGNMIGTVDYYYSACSGD